MIGTKVHKHFSRCVGTCLLILSSFVGWCVPTHADWLDDIEYNKLASVLGPSFPNGAGVPISIVEATDIRKDAEMNITRNSYKPDPSDPRFTSNDPLGEDVEFFDASSNACSPTCIGFSGHATFQAQTILGNPIQQLVGGVPVNVPTSAAPAANYVTVYQADNYLQNVLKLDGGHNTLPISQDFRVQNFSWIHSHTTVSGTPLPNKDREALRRFDYTVDQNNITALVGLNNNTAELPSLFSHSYNAIAVGRRDGGHSSGLTHLADYGVGRSKPDLVAPGPSTSTSTSMVSSAATFLHSADTVIGTDAANSQTMKAILLAGATKTQFPNWSHLDAGGEWHPLDDTFGAGEVNVYNSYLTTLGGQFAGSKTAPPTVASHGWDFQTVLPGASNTLNYNLVIPAGSTAKELSIVLAWNAEVAAPFNMGAPTLANLTLQLVNSTGTTVDLNTSDTFLDGLSNSPVDNVEHIYLTDLAAGTYTLKVSSSDLSSDFGLAWRTKTAFDSPSADFNGDGFVNSADFFTWQRGYGTLLTATHAMGDANGDGNVDNDDLAAFESTVAGTTTLVVQSIAAIPEPSAVLLAGLALLLGCGLRPRRS